MTEQRSDVVDNMDLMTAREVAHALGISVRTLERYVSERLIPFVRLPMRGSRSGTRFLRSEITKWLRKSTIRPEQGKDEAA